MSVDIYVMPLWRFFAGDFDSALYEMLGDKAFTVTPDGAVRPVARQSGVSFWARSRAKRRARRHLHAVDRANGRPIERWDDNGPSKFISSFSYTGSIIAAFATYLCYREQMKTFGHPEERWDFGNHPVWKLRQTDPKPNIIPHLTATGMYNGYLYPVDFERPEVVDTWKFHHWTFHARAASVIRAVHEIELLERETISDEHFDDSEVAVALRTGVATLRTATSLALERRLPVIFYG